MQVKWLMLALGLVACANPVPQDEQPRTICPIAAPVGCSGRVDLPSCTPSQSLDEWVEQMDIAENGNTDQPI